MRFYRSRKRAQPQFTRVPLLWHGPAKRYYCFAHMQRRYQCKACSRDLCPAHLAACEECCHCGNNKHGQLVPCDAHHRRLVQECPDCTNESAFTSMDAWQLCGRHAHIRGSTLKQRQKRSHVYQLAVVRCRQCVNVLETKATARKRHDHVVHDYNRACGRRDDAVQQDDPKVDGQNDLQQHQAQARDGGGNVDHLKL